MRDCGTVAVFSARRHALNRASGSWNLPKRKLSLAVGRKHHVLAIRRPRYADHQSRILSEPARWTAVRIHDIHIAHRTFGAADERDFGAIGRRDRGPVSIPRDRRRGEPGSTERVQG